MLVCTLHMKSYLPVFLHEVFYLCVFSTCSLLPGMTLNPFTVF